jgi:hypothetical protein
MASLEHDAASIFRPQMGREQPLILPIAGSRGKMRDGGNSPSTMLGMAPSPAKSGEGGTLAAEAKATFTPLSRFAGEGS